MNEDKVIIKYPMMPQYLVMDFDSLTESMAIQSGEEADFDKILESASKLSDEMSLDMTLAVLAAIDDSEMVYEKNHVFMVDGAEVKSAAVTINFTKDTFVNVFNAYFDYMMNSEAFYNYIKEYSIEDMGTFEDYKQSFAEAKEELVAEFKDSDVEIDKIFKKLKFDVIIGFEADDILDLSALTEIADGQLAADVVQLTEDGGNTTVSALDADSGAWVDVVVLTDTAGLSVAALDTDGQLVL